MLRQIGVEGIVTALHDVPNGEIWALEAIEDLKGYIESFGLRWSVVESLPVCEEYGVNMCVHPDDPPFQVLGLPMRVDHGRMMLGDEDKGYNAGYSFHGRMLALAQVEGMMAVVDDELSGKSDD